MLHPLAFISPGTSAGFPVAWAGTGTYPCALQICGDGVQQALHCRDEAPQRARAHLQVELRHQHLHSTLPVSPAAASLPAVPSMFLPDAWPAEAESSGVQALTEAESALMTSRRRSSCSVTCSVMSRPRSLIAPPPLISELL